MSTNNLTVKELYKLSGAAADLYRLTDRSKLVHKIATLANEAIAMENSGVWEVDTATLQQKNTFSHPGVTEMANKSWPVYAHYAKRYPMFTDAMLKPTNKGKVFVQSDLLPHSVVEPTGMIDDYARPNFCEFQLIYYFKQYGSRSAFLTCNRNTRDYSLKEKRILEFLVPHFQSAYENSGAFEDKVAAVQRAAAIQQTLSAECLWVDHRLQVKEATPRAAEFIREFFAEEFTAGALPEKLLAWLRTHAPSAPAHPPLVPLLVDRDGASLKIRLYPDRLPGLHLLTFTRRITKPTVEHLKPLGLTPRETEILLWVAQAKTNDEIARLLGCSSRTVAKHMEHLLLKLKVENRSAAMILVADLLQD
jgi:DNA-binding CsgD family transcriptional regulator